MRGADMVEVDPRQTADGVFILMHDSTLSRTTDQPLLFPGRDQVTDLTWAEVQQLTISDPFDRCTAANADDKPERCRVPSLTQALDAARGEALVMLDFKSGDPAAIGSQLASADATDFAILFDADLATLAAARAQAPDLITVPRATDAASARDLLASDHPAVLHADTGYLAEIQADALAGKAKLLVNIFVEVDFWLVFWREDGLDTSLAEGRDNLFEILDNGGRIVQTNLSSEVLDLVAEWRRQRGE